MLPSVASHECGDYSVMMPTASTVLRKFCATLQPGESVYEIRHFLGSEDVIVQTRIARRIREGGISIVDANHVRLTFGGTLYEPLDVVIIG